MNVGSNPTPCSYNWKMKEIKVKQCEYRRARAPNILETTGIGPCIAIGAIYRNKGHMIHVSSLSLGGLSERLVARMLQNLKTEEAGRKFLKLFIAGGGLVNDEEVDQTILKDREATLEMISEVGLESYIRKIGWNERWCTQTLALHLEENMAVYESLSDYLDGFEPDREEVY